MERRALLGTVAALGTGAIAGCSGAPRLGGGDGASGGDGGGSGGGGDDGGGSGGDEGSESGDDADGGDGDDQAGGEAAERAIARAVSALNAVALRLNKRNDQLDSSEAVDLDEETLLDGVEEARGELDAASETATDAQAAQVETLRNLATVLEETTRVVAVLLSVDPNAVAQDTRTAVEAGDYDAALSRVSDAKEKASDARARTETAESALAGVDPDRLAAVDGVEYAKVEAAVTETASLVDAFNTLTVGYEATLMGAQDLETGRAESEAEQFEAAEAAFERGRTHFETGDETFSGAAAETPEDLRDTIDVAACQTTHLMQAAAAFQDAAGAAADGDRAEAKRARDEGEAQMRQVEDCEST